MNFNEEKSLNLLVAKRNMRVSSCSVGCASRRCHQDFFFQSQKMRTSGFCLPKNNHFLSLKTKLFLEICYNLIDRRALSLEVLINKLVRIYHFKRLFLSGIYDGFYAILTFTSGFLCIRDQK